MDVVDFKGLSILFRLHQYLVVTAFFALHFVEIQN